MTEVREGTGKGVAWVKGNFGKSRANAIYGSDIFGASFESMLGVIP